MKILISILLLLQGISASDQEMPEEIILRHTVEAFCEAFHRQDSTALRDLTHSSIRMQSISTDAQGKVKISTESYDNFLKSILSIPGSTKFEEKLRGFEIRIRGALAHVLAPYSFYVNGNLSHCGVNSFQLFKQADEWKIIYIVDTREKGSCIKN